MKFFSKFQKFSTIVNLTGHQENAKYANDKIETLTNLNKIINHKRSEIQHLISPNHLTNTSKAYVIVIREVEKQYFS